MQPNQQNPYGFILDDKPKRRGFSFGGNSQKDRLLQVAIAAIIFIALAFIIITVLGNVGKESKDNLYKVAAAQQDVIELTALGVTNARDTQLINASVNAGAVIATQNNQVLAAISSAGDKKPTKVIATYRDTTYTKLLDEAKANGKYDETYTALFSNRLDDYRAKLQNAYVSAKSATLKKQLSDAYVQLNLLGPAVVTN